MHKSLREHAANCTRPEQVRDSILECSIARAYAGDSSNLRLAVDGQLQNISLCLTRSLVAACDPSHSFDCCLKEFDTADEPLRSLGLTSRLEAKSFLIARMFEAGLISVLVLSF